MFLIPGFQNNERIQFKINKIIVLLKLNGSFYSYSPISKLLKFENSDVFSPV